MAAVDRRLYKWIIITTINLLYYLLTSCSQEAPGENSFLTEEQLEKAKPLSCLRMAEQSTANENNEILILCLRRQHSRHVLHESVP